MAVPLGQARRLMLDPGLISGGRAHQIGLVHELHDKPAARAIQVAESMAAKPPHALAATKRWLNELSPADAEHGLGVSASLVGNAESRRLLTTALQKPANEVNR